MAFAIAGIHGGTKAREINVEEASSGWSTPWGIPNSTKYLLDDIAGCAW